MNERIQYRRCDDGDRESLSQLWALCFPEDTAEDVDTFFADLFALSEPFAGFIGDTAVTMLYLLPAEVRHTDWRVPVWYLYAGGTHPSHRSCGYYRELMQYAYRWACASDGCAIYLRPAQPSLFAYYASLGYTDAIVSYSHTDVGSDDWAPMPMDDYCRERSAISSAVALWEPINPIASAFFAAKQHDGWQAVKGDDGRMVLVDGRHIMEQLPIDTDHLATACGAVWLPATDNAAVVSRLRDAVGYSLLFGD